MDNIVDFNSAVKKKQEGITTGCIVAAKIGSPNMLVLFTNGEDVEVVYVEPVEGNESVEATFKVEDLYIVLQAPLFNADGYWSNKI